MAHRTAFPEVQSLADDVARAIREVLGEDVHILWFGSWIAGTAVERSDLDVAVDRGRSLTGAECDEIRRRIEALPTLRHVDVVDLQTTSSRFRDKVLQEGKPL